MITSFFPFLLFFPFPFSLTSVYIYSVGESLIIIVCFQVDSEFNAGRYAEAQRASETAKTVNYVGLGIGTALIVLYVVIIIIANVAAAASA